MIAPFSDELLNNTDGLISCILDDGVEKLTNIVNEEDLLTQYNFSDVKYYPPTYVICSILSQKPDFISVCSMLLLLHFFFHFVTSVSFSLLYAVLIFLPISFCSDEINYPNNYKMIFSFPNNSQCSLYILIVILGSDIF